MMIVQQETDLTINLSSPSDRRRGMSESSATPNAISLILL